MTFQSTMWTLIAQAKGGAREAVEQLLERYRPPILQYLRKAGLSEHDAEDIAQEVFVEISQDEFLQSADRAKGKFRTLLMRVTQFVIASHYRKEYASKRGGHRPIVSLDQLENVHVTREDNDRFNELWARHLISLGMERLKEDQVKLKAPYHTVLTLRFLEGKSNAEIAAVLNCKAHDVENHLYQGKKRLKRYLVDISREYCATNEERDEELQLLERFAP